MPGIKIEVFGGMIPAVDKRLLPPNNAQESLNTWLYDGRIRGMRAPKELHTLVNAAARRVYRIPLGATDPANMVNSRWLEFNSSEVSVLKSPVKDITDQRYYWAGEVPAPFSPMMTTQSRIEEGTDPLLLGIIPPTSSLTVVPSGGVSTINETRSYVHTYVSVYGEEGPPSNPTAATTGKIDDTWTVTIPAVGTDRGGTTVNITAITQAAQAQITANAHGRSVGNRIFIRGVVGMTQINNKYATVTQVVNANNIRVNIDSTAFTAYGSGGTIQPVTREITKINIYRTVTTDQGTAEYYFVTQVDAHATSYADTQASSAVANNEPLTSQLYDPPPALDGFVQMPNGILIGWLDNQVYFSEPYKPHAWPATYGRATAFDVIGIGVVGQSAVLCTEGIPEICTGTHPENMKLAQIGSNPYACASQNSIVSLPAGVFYASDQGLILVGPGAPDVVTKSLMSQDNWQTLVASRRLNAAVLNGCYLGYSGIFEGAFDEDAFEEPAFEMGDVSDTRAGLMIDFNDARVSMNKINFPMQAKNVFQDPWTTEVLVIMDGKVYVLDTTAVQNEGDYLWWSKEFRMDKPTNFGIGRIFYNPPDNFATPTGELTVYGDGVEIYSRSLPASGAEFRLPGARLYDFYSFKVEGNVQVQNMQFATTAKELRGL